MTLDHYEIESPIEVGGMGVLALQIPMHDAVLMSVRRPSLPFDDETLREGGGKESRWPKVPERHRLRQEPRRRGRAEDAQNASPPSVEA